MSEIEALQNAANATNLKGLVVHEYLHQDKRKSIKKYFVKLANNGTISPILDYEQMNHFLLGMISMNKIINKQ
jgi:hypothetical protein